MPGLQDLLRNPRRLRQFAETPGNYNAALDFASQGNVGRRPASRSYAPKKADEPNTLETGEVIEQISLPDGSLVKPATESGRLVKAPGKSNLYLDPTTGEPYNADPSQPSGLRSAWQTATKKARDGKIYASISGVGEREIGPDPKVAEDATKAAAKRETENRRLALAREKRPYNIDRVTGEPVPLQTDEEWAAIKQAKAAKLDEAARVKRLKDQADVIDLEADRISLTAPKPAKEDEEAFTAAESALSQFAAGQDMEEVATKYAAAPATDEASQQAKAAAENYLAYKDKVKPAKEAEKKVQELKLRALDIKEQIINPQKWKKGKTASLAALPDDALVAEVQAQADIINEQEEQAVGTLDFITKGRNKIVNEINAFQAERQVQATMGLSADEIAALDSRQAELEQALADYDEHNSEAKAESDAALKAAADRRDVLAVAGTELEGRAAKQAEAATQAKAKAETMAKAKPLYEGWAKEMYADDWRTENFPRLEQEAAKAGLDVEQAKDALQTYRQLDWSNTRRDVKTAKPIAEESRTLPDGNVTVNPTMWGDAEAYKKAVEASQGTPEGKAKALEAFPKLQEIHAEKAVEILSQSANIPGADNFMAWRERKIEEDQATQGKLGFARQSPAKQAIAYMDEMKNRSWFRKAGEQVAMGLLAGFQDIATQALGVTGMVTGSETLADLAAANAANTQAVVGAQNLEGSDTDYALRVMGMGARMTPAVAAMIAGAGAVGGGLGTAAVLAGGQTAGSMFADLYRTAKEDAGLSHGEAWRKAALPAALAGTITGLLTKGMGATGLERVFSDSATQEAARNTFKAMLGQFVKGAAEELPEEIADEYFTTILQESAASADPVATFKNFANTLPELAGVTALMGGAGALMQARRQAGTEGPGMAPPPEGEAPAMPVQPRPAGPAPTPAPETPQDVVEQIAKFNPTGATPLPKAVADTAKSTGRPVADVARQAASGAIKIAQGAKLEDLDAREREALGFINKDGKIVAAPKTTPLVEIHKGQLVVRNEVAEWLTDEAQEGLAGMVNLTEAERKAQIDAEEAAAKAKPAAKKKAGQAKAAKAESTPQDSEVVITGGSLPPNAGASPAPATIPTPEPAPANEPQPQTTVSPEPEIRQDMPESRELPMVPEQPPAPAQEAPPEPAPAASQPAEPALTPAQADQMARAKAEYDSAMRAANADPEPEIREKKKKAAGMRFSAAKRIITGKLTAKEAEAKAKREASNYEGKAVSVDGKNAEVIGNAFGKVKVKFADGTKAAVPAAKVKPPVEAAAVDEAGPAAEEEWQKKATHDQLVAVTYAGQEANRKFNDLTPNNRRTVEAFAKSNLPTTDANIEKVLESIGMTGAVGGEIAAVKQNLPIYRKIEQWKQAEAELSQRQRGQSAAAKEQAKEAKKAAKQPPARPEVSEGEWIIDANGSMGPVIGFENGVPVIGMEGENEGDVEPYTVVAPWTKEPTPASAKPSADTKPAQEPAPAPAEASQPAPAAKLPEQMTPEEANAQISVQRLKGATILRWKDESGKDRQVQMAVRSDLALKAFHQSEINRAFRTNQPVNAAAVDAYGIALPTGYVREGDLYVYRPEASPAPASQEAGQAEGKSDFMRERDATIKASKEAGNIHLDAERRYVENSRGREIYNVHDPKERGIIRTVSNQGEVVVHWNDEYSGEKNLATIKKEKQERKEIEVRESWLMPTDLKDYAFYPPKASQPKAQAPTAPPARPSTPEGRAEAALAEYEAEVRKTLIGQPDKAAKDLAGRKLDLAKRLLARLQTMSGAVDYDVYKPEVRDKKGELAIEVAPGGRSGILFVNPGKLIERLAKDYPDKNEARDVMDKWILHEFVHLGALAKMNASKIERLYNALTPEAKEASRKLYFKGARDKDTGAEIQFADNFQAAHEWFAQQVEALMRGEIANSADIKGISDPTLRESMMALLRDFVAQLREIANLVQGKNAKIAAEIRAEADAVQAIVADMAAKAGLEIQPKAEEPQVGVPRFDGDPNIGREWNSPAGRQRIISVEKWGGRDNYTVKTLETGGERIYDAPRLEESIKRDEYETTPEYAAEKAERKARAERQAAAEKASAEAAALAAVQVNSYYDDIGLSPMQKGKMKAALDQVVTKSSQNKTYTGPRYTVVEQMLADGYQPKVEQVPAFKEPTRTQINRMDNRQAAEYERKRQAAGTKTEYSLETADGGGYVVTKAEHDYAKWLQAKAGLELGRAEGGQAEVTPPAASPPAPQAEPAQASQDEADKALAEAFTGLFLPPSNQASLRLPPQGSLEQTDLPRDRRDAMMKAASVLVDAGVKTPAELAARLDKLAPGGQLRQYSRAFWRLMTGFDSTLEENPDWQAVYQPAPPAVPEVARQADSPAGAEGKPMAQAAAAATITKEQAEEVLKDSTLKDRPIKTYEMAVAANQVHMGTKISDWSAFPFTGEAQDGRPTQNLAGASEMQKAPTLFPTSNSQDHGNCEWCGKQPVKNFYHIKNDGKKWTLAVGSECITHFADQSGDEMAGEARQSLALATIQGITEARKTLSKEFSEVQPAGYGRTERVWRSPPARTLTDEAPDILGKITIESGAAAHSRWLNTKLDAAREWLARYAELMARPETKKRQIEWRTRRIKEIETTLKLKNKPEWELASLEKKLEELRSEKAAIEGTTATPPAVPTAADEITSRQRLEAARIKADEATAKKEALQAKPEPSPAQAVPTAGEAEAPALPPAEPYASPLAQFVGEWLGMNASQQSRVDMPQRVIRLADNQADTEAVMALVKEASAKGADGEPLFNTPHQRLYNELREMLRFMQRKGTGTEKGKVSTQITAAPDLTPTQTAAVAKEEAMPEPAKQAAPFDATAAKGQKKFLLAEVAAAVKAAPRRSEMTQEQKDTINSLESLPPALDKASTKPEADRLRLSLAAAKADAERLVGYVTIEVPGDGIFTILNEKGALAQFQKRADKFPVSTIRDDLPAKPTAQAPTAVPALKKPKTTADVVAAMFPMVSTDATRGTIIQKVKGDGTYLWATDGRVAARVEQENGGGKGAENVIYDEKGNAEPVPTDERNPSMEAVIPDDKAFPSYTLDTARWFSLMSQARAVLKTLPGEEDSQYKSASLYRNPDGSLGVFASDVNRGDYAHNIQPEAKFLAAYNPEYFQTILRVARNLGNEQIELRIQDDVSPATLRAGKALFVLMPMRVNGAAAYSPEAQAARPAPPVTADPSQAPAPAKQTREEAAEAARAIAGQDPSIPPPAPDDLETLQALRDRANRKGYKPDKITPARLAVGIRAGWVTKTKEAKLTEKGYSQLAEWEQQQSAHDRALGALSDKLVDEAVSKWDRENDPTSWEAINAATQTQPEPSPAPAKPRPMNMAGQVRPEKKKVEKFTLPPREPFKPTAERFAQFYRDFGLPEDVATKNGAAMMAAIETGEWTNLLHPDNKRSRAIWDTWTRQKLPAGVKASEEAFAKFITEYHATSNPVADLTEEELGRELLRIGPLALKPYASDATKARALALAKENQARQPSQAAQAPASQPAQPSAPEAGQGGEVQAITGFDSARAFIGQLREGQVTAEQVRTAWAQLKAARPAILADLNKMKVDDLLPMAGISARKSDGKAAIAKSVLGTLDLYFNPDDSISYSYGGNFEANKDAAMDEKVAKWTDEMIVEQARARREDAEARKAAREKALSNPETLDEWNRFVFAKGRQALTAEDVQKIKKMKSGRNEAVIRKGETLLTPEQLAAYDAVRGITRKEEAQARTEAKARVYGVASGVEADIIETKHTQKGHDLFVVKLSERVERPVYDRLNAAAKKLGGYYSSYSKGGAVPGFQFTTRAAAENFIAVSKGETVDQKEQIQERQEAKKSATAARLTAVAEALDAKADGILNADRKTNTVKRAREAAGQEATARKMKAMAQTMRNLAAAMESGEATHLDGVKAGTHVETLDGMARGAMLTWINAKNLGYTERQKAEAEGPTAEMMDTARIPYPYIDKSTILNMVEAGRKTAGAKLLAERVAKIQMNEDDGRAVTLRRDDDLENVKELAQKVYYAGGDYWNSIKWKYETYDRLKAMGLTNLPSLRAALREYLQYRGKAAKADPVKAMERELIGMKLPGFFPTPRPIIDEMIGMAGIEPGMKVLEPSAGKGDIAEAAQEAGAEVDAIELSTRLQNILKAKGLNVIDSDFTSREPVAEYDAVVMNPPFENGQDMEHIQHAYKFLKPGGKLVAIMSAGPFYRQDKQATAFREWLDGVNGSHEAMPEGSFAGADAFRQTGVRTQMVTITKPVQPALALPPGQPAVTAGQDAEYLAAVEAGDMAKAQAMVDEAAKKAGYDRKLFHGTNATETVEGESTSGSAQAIENLKALAERVGLREWYGATSVYQRLADNGQMGVTQEDAANAKKWQAEATGTYEPSREKLAFDVFSPPSGELELGVHLGNESAAAMFGEVFPFFAKLGKPFRLPDLGTWNYQSVIRELRKRGVKISESEYDAVFNANDNNESLRSLLKGKGIPSIVYRNEAEGEGDSFIAFDPEQIKSADPVTRDESGQVIPLSQRFNPQSDSILRNPPAPEGGPAAEGEEAGQTDADMEAFIAEQQAIAEEEVAAQEALRNDPDAIDAVQASGMMSGRNLSKQFEYPEARAVYQALTAARDQLGGPETVQLDKLREWAKKTFDSDPEKYVQWAADMAEDNKLLDVDEQAVLGQAFQFLTREARLTGDKNIRALLNKVGNYYLDTGTRLAQAMSARRDPLESPQERWTKALDIVFGPSEAVRRKLRILPTEAGKARRIASLEAELAEARGSRRADVEAALKTARAQETKEELLEKDDAESQKIKERVLKNIGVTEDDLMLSGTDRVALQSAILDLPAVKEGLDAYKGKDNDGYNIMRLAFRGFSDAHIANALNLNQDDVGQFIHDATNAIIRPAVAEQVKAGTGFGGLIKAGFARLKKAVGLGLPPKIRPLEDWRTLIKGKKQTLDQVTAEVNRVMGYALQSAKARNSGKLMSKVINTPSGQKVRVFVPFDPDDMANYYAFAREFTAAKSSAFDKAYEYWINWPLLSGPQTQVANITGNAAQVAWHYTGQRFTEAFFNLFYQDPNAPQYREFKHILKGFWQGIGPAFDMARQTFLTEGDTIRHKYLGQPLEIDVVDGDLDKVGNIRASLGGTAGRINRLPGRVLRFTDAFFKTAIMYAEASAVAYRRAHVAAKAQGLKGKARADFIDTEIANTLNDTSSAVWGEVMKTAEELLFQDDNSATEIVDTVLGGYKGIKDLEKLLAEAEAKGDSDLAAKLQKRIRSRKFVGSLMRWIFPFQRTPTNIVRAGIKKAGGSAISLLYGLTMAGWRKHKDGTDFIKSYPKAMQIKDASETLLAGLGWLALASMLEGDDNDDEKPVLLVGTRSHSLKERAATDQFLRKYGGENSIVWQDGKGKVLGSLPFGRYEPAATLLTTWIDAYRNYQEVKRLKSQGENASYSTYMLSSLVSSLEDKSFLQGFANAMQFIRDVEEKRENPDENAGVKMLMNNVIPNLIKQPLRNMDDVLRERTTAGPGYAALPNPTVAPKLPAFAAQPKISTTGERLPKAFTPPVRLLFQANTKVTPQPDALLYRANRLHPTKRWSPQPLNRDDYTADPPGKAKPVPITDPAKRRQFAELAGRLYATKAAQVAARAMPSERQAPGESLIKAFRQAREDANAAARKQAHAMGLHKATVTP